MEKYTTALHRFQSQLGLYSCVISDLYHHILGR